MEILSNGVSIGEFEYSNYRVSDIQFCGGNGEEGVFYRMTGITICQGHGLGKSSIFGELKATTYNNFNGTGCTIDGRGIPDCGSGELNGISGEQII